MESEQTQVEAKQDAVLGDMEQSLHRITLMGHQIGHELQESHQELHDIDHHLDENTAHQNIVVQKLTKLLQSSEKGKFCCIFVLVVILVVLLILLFSP